MSDPDFYRRPGESEYDLCVRRGEEARARAAAHDAEIARHKREGTHIDMGPAGFWSLGGMPKEGVWS